MEVKLVESAEIAQTAIREGAAQKPSELTAFIGWLALQPALGTVVEIGTLRGGTLAAWCELAAEDASIVSIDLPGGAWGGGYTIEDVPRLQSFAKPGQSLALITGDSHDPATHAELLTELDGPIDFLFIDGDHSYEGVKADFDDYAPFVRAGGIVAFHDVLPHPDVPGCDVDCLWQTLKAIYPHAEFLDPGNRHPEWGQWGGIGALIV